MKPFEVNCIHTCLLTSMMVLCCSDVDVGDAGDADNEGVSCRDGDVTAAKTERLDCDKGSAGREKQIAVGRLTTSGQELKM